MYSLKARAAAKLIEQLSSEERDEILGLLEPSLWTVMTSISDAAGQLDMDETDTWVGLPTPRSIQFAINTIVGFYSNPEKAYRGAVKYYCTEYGCPYEDFQDEGYYFTESDLNSENRRFPEPLSRILPQSAKDRILNDLVKNNPW